MKNKILLPFLIILLLISSCSRGPKTDEEIFYEAQKRILNIDDYTCIARIKVYGNKEPISYVMRQWYKAPNMYKIEIIEPETLKGKTTIYNGKRAYVSHPRIGQEWTMESVNNDEKRLFLGHFIDNFFNGEESQIKRDFVNGREYIVLTTEIPGNNPHFSKEKLWFDIEEYYPFRLQILNHKNKIIVDAQYYDFKINNKLEEGLFYIGYYR